METKKQTKETKETKENGATVLIIAPKVTSLTAMQYNGMNDLPALIGFTGRLPQINADMSLQIKKYKILPGNVIVRDSYGNIINVLSTIDAYEVKLSEPYSDKWKIEIPAEEKKERKPRAIKADKK